ncbi:MAG: alpha/beta hydrolase [Oscillospiraceae bacterium]|nr:alpha/beta hydrolase [Oscillospiraceae bacterium]
MKLYEFGKKNTTTIMCLPGNFMTHRQFENIVPLLENDYHVITVSFDGYDETGETVYTTAKEQAEKLTSFIKENLGGRIDLVYAESLGSVPAAWLTQMDISIGGVILSGAEYMNYGIFNKPAIAMFSPFTYKLMNKMVTTENVKFPKFLQIKMGITNDTFKPMLKQACQKLTLETTRATFWEGVRFYPEYVSKWEPNDKIPVACWYGEKEMNMKKAIKHLKRAFPKLDVHPFKNMGHGENMRHPELVVRDLKAFMMKNNII